MPELPEVETIRRDLSKLLIDRRFQKIIIIDFKNVAPSAAFLAKKLPGLIISALERRGKLLIFKLIKADTRKVAGNLLFHLKMTGQLIYQNGKSSLAGGHSLSGDSFLGAVGGPLPNRFTRAQFNLSGGAKLFFNDMRKFAYLKLVDDQELDRLLEKSYGPEPLSSAFSLKFFQEILSKRTTNIKALLLKQDLIAGLGNIYVDEVLFMAGISPTTIAKSLRQEQSVKLYQAIKKVLRQAILYRGTTFSNFVDSRGRQGNYSKRLQVYNRAGQTCYICQQTIKKIKLAGRGTHYCPRCQV